MSNVYPDALRERMFSTNFMYFYTNNGYNLGLNQTENKHDGSYLDINDMYFELLSKDEFGVEDAYGLEDIRSILNVKDDRSWFLSGYDEYGQNWDYPAISEDNMVNWFTYYNPTEDKRLPSFNTYSEF